MCEGTFSHLKKMQVSTRIVMNFWSETHKCPPPKSTSTPCLSNLLLPAQYSPNALQLGRYAAAEGFRQATYFGNFWKTPCVSQRLGANHRNKESKFSFPRCPKYDTYLSVSGRLPLTMYLPPSPCHCVVMIASPACHSTKNSSVPSATSEPTQRDVRAVRDADTDPQRGPDHCICPLKISPNFD